MSPNVYRQLETQEGFRQLVHELKKQYVRALCMLALIEELTGSEEAVSRVNKLGVGMLVSLAEQGIIEGILAKLRIMLFSRARYWPLCISIFWARQESAR